MPNTTNYNWATPADSDLVKDGAAAIRTLGSSIDSTLKTQIDAQIPDSLLTTTGDTIYATGASTPARLPIGSTGQVLTVAGGVPTWTTPVSGSLIWTNRLAATGNTFNQIAYNGTNLYVAVGAAGQLYTSPDGLTWTSRTSGFGANEGKDVAFGNGLWVAIANGGLISTSSDGVTWTLRTANMATNDMNAVTYANSLWVVVGGGGGTTNTGGITYSTDGITWTRKSQSLTVGAQYYAVAWNGTNWIVGAAVQTSNNYLYATTPSGTWTAASILGGNTVQGVWWDGTKHIINNNNNWYYTTSGTTLANNAGYNSVPSYGTSNNQAKLYNGSIYTLQTYLQSFVASATVNPIVGTPTINPTSIFNGTSLVANVGTIGVFAVGTILADNRGRIYTSF